MTDDAGQDSAIGCYHLEEYKAVRAEIMFYLREIEQLSRVALVAVAAIYVWILTSFEPEADLERLAVAIWWLPSVVIAVSWKKTEDMIRRIRTLADYLVRVQARFADAELGGWETFARGEARITRRNRAGDWTSRLVWAVSLIASLGLAARVTVAAFS